MNSKLQATALFIAALTLHSQAVTVATPSGSTTTDPGTGVQWDNVLDVVGTQGSAVYLGGGWVLTANHVFDDPPITTSTTVAFAGTNYDADPSQIYDLTNPVFVTGSTSPDLKLFRLTETLPLPTVAIGSVSVTDAVTMIGFSGGKSWGNNNIEFFVTNVLGNGRNSNAFWTDYDPATTNEGQGATGDSGGGVFVENGGIWELAGIMIGIGPLVDGGQTGTFSVNLNTYASEINDIIASNGSAIPEPGTLVLLSLVGLVAMRRQR